MILRDALVEVAKRQMADFRQQEFGIKRELAKEIGASSSHAVIISGIRRCGKSTLLKQLMKKHEGGYYFSFEDQRASSFEVNDFEKLDEIFNELYGPQQHYFLDEVQNVPGWERFVRSMQDHGKKFFITGSNASLLSKELGTKLTGRHLTYELFPFSYSEMLELKKMKPSLESFQEYFTKGGFPEYLKQDNPALLQQAFKDILMRDIVVRYGLRNTKLVEELALYLLANISKEFSYNQLKKTFGVGSTNTMITYISYYEESYLLFTIPRFDYSYKKQLVSPKKVYAIDSGMAKSVSVSLSDDKGRMLENIAFLHLRRKYKDIYYYKGKNECDFLVREKGKISQAFQVCYELNSDNTEREIKGLKEAMEKFKLKTGTMLTFKQKDELDNIKVIPTWKWLLE